MMAIALPRIGTTNIDTILMQISAFRRFKREGEALLPPNRDFRGFVSANEQSFFTGTSFLSLNIKCVYSND
jgi:hypothetical protein